LPIISVIKPFIWVYGINHKIISIWPILIVQIQTFIKVKFILKVQNVIKIGPRLIQFRNFVGFLGGGHFEFSSEKNWGVEQEDFRIFDSIDMTHLAASIASVPFNVQHDIPVELFTVCNS